MYCQKFFKNLSYDQDSSVSVVLDDGVFYNLLFVFKAVSLSLHLYLLGTQHFVRHSKAYSLKNKVTNELKMKMQKARLLRLRSARK